jgi:predicted RNA-binding Zn-ribbon protein involved in translation (DUF1610 family)
VIEETKQEGIRMDSPQSDRAFHCPECGALLAIGVDHCWKCRREFQQTAAAAGSPGEPASNAAEGDTSYGLPPFPNKMRHPPLSARDATTLGLKTLGAVLAIMMAAGAAFFTTCLGGVFLGNAVSPRAGYGELEWLPEGFIAGCLAALAVSGGLIWRFWIRPRKNDRP